MLRSFVPFPFCFSVLLMISVNSLENSSFRVVDVVVFGVVFCVLGEELLLLLFVELLLFCPICFAYFLRIVFVKSMAQNE